MPKSNASLKTNIRKTVLSSYRARGKAVNNLWLVYSPKTDSDWILPSDRQLIHWLSFLESNPDVKTFDLDPDPVLSHDGDEDKATILDAIVILYSGATEWHEVKAGSSLDIEPQHRSQFVAQNNLATKNRVTYKRFNDIELEPRAKFAMRWLEAIGYAAAIRGRDFKTLENVLTSIIKERKKGKIINILDEMEGYDFPVIIGILIRLSGKGLLNLDLESKNLGFTTSWSIGIK